MFLTSEETGGPLVFALRQSNRYLAIHDVKAILVDFDIRELAEALGRDAGETWQEHEGLILLACRGGKLFEWLNKAEGDKEVLISQIC